MRKTKAVKASSILLSVMLMLCTLTVHSTAAPVFASIPQEAASTPREVQELNEAARHLETTSALDEAGVTYTICEAGYIWIPFTEEPLCWSILGPSDEELALTNMLHINEQHSISNEDEPYLVYDQINNIWFEPTVGTFDGWYFYMYYDPEVGLYFVPNFALHFDPTIPMFYIAHYSMLLENHTIVCASESIEICSTYWLECNATPAEPFIEVIWSDSEEEYYYNTHGRLRNLSDYLYDSEYNMFRLSGLTLEDFLLSGMAQERHGRHRAFNAGSDTNIITNE